MIVNLFSEHAVLMFHSRSRDAPPGQGVGELIAPPFTHTFQELAAIANWRRLLSNFAKSPFELGGLRWLSVEHCFQAHKFINVAPSYFRSFALDSGSALSTSLGAPVKRAGGRRGLPLDAHACSAWEKVKHEVQEAALLAKYQQNCEFRRVLLATGDAKLTHKPARSKYTIVEFGLMRVRQKLAECSFSASLSGRHRSC